MTINITGFDILTREAIIKEQNELLKNIRYSLIHNINLTLTYKYVKKPIEIKFNKEFFSYNDEIYAAEELVVCAILEVLESYIDKDWLVKYTKNEYSYVLTFLHKSDQNITTKYNY